MKRMYPYAKRTLDFTFSLVALVCALPLCLLIALCIKMDSKGPIFFKQKRVGKLQQPFYLYKFRSMVPNTYQPYQLGPIKHNHFLVTRVGYVLRRLKLDEIPQFINVIRGDMSLIGPRPCLYETLTEMTEQEKTRFNILPGISGWAEVNGNVELSWAEQLGLDIWYVHHQSFTLDVRIFFKTIITVLFGSVRNDQALKQAETYIRT